MNLSTLSTYLFLLFVEVINNDSDEKVERKERAEDDEEDEVEVHVDVDFPDRLLTELQGYKQITHLIRWKYANAIMTPWVLKNFLKNLAPVTAKII